MSERAEISCGTSFDVKSEEDLSIVCTDFAMNVYQALLGKAECKIMWVGVKKSAGAHVLINDESHDFCLVLDRFIVDPWVKNVAGLSAKAVYDLQDPADVTTILQLYGDTDRFMRLSSLEDRIKANLNAASLAESGSSSISSKAPVLRRRVP